MSKQQRLTIRFVSYFFINTVLCILMVIEEKILKDVDVLAITGAIYLLISGLLVFIYFSKDNRNILIKVFIIAFILFSGGHLFVILLGGYNDFLMYIWHNGRYNQDTYKYCIMYTVVSVIMLENGFMLSSLRKEKKSISRRFVIKLNISVRSVIKVLFIVFFLLSVYLMSIYSSLAVYSDIYKVSYGRYYNIAVLGSLLCIPLYLIIQTWNNHLWCLISNIVMIVLIITSLTIGMRGDAIRFMIPLVFANKEMFTKFKLRTYFLMIIGIHTLITVLYLVSITRLRNVGVGEWLSLFVNNFFSTTSIKALMREMGGSIRNLFEITRYYSSSKESFKYGLTYLYSILIILPGFLRGPLDAIAVERHWTSLAAFITNISGADYGLGGSIQMEAYMNFASIGMLFFIIIGYIIGLVLQKKRFSDDIFDYYYKVALLAFLIVLPRTTMQDNIKRIVLCCIIPMFLYYASLPVNERKDLNQF